MNKETIINDSIDIIKSLREEVRGTYIPNDKKIDAEIAIINATAKIMQARIIAEELNSIAGKLTRIGRP